jgi:short-subunit dehydrogenase
MSLVDGTVLVTGATGGLGQAIAEAFAARGASLILTGRRADVLEQLAERLRARAIVADLGDRGELERLVGEAGAVDVLICNAGLPGTGTLAELTQRQLDAMLEVNLRAPIALARALSAGMVARRRGHLVFISSLSGKAAGPSASMYSAAKFGVRGFALGLREDLRRDNVGVSVVLPGFISGAGLFADAGVRLPRLVGTRTPEQVAAATIRAIERNLAEVTVAPALLRVGADFASIAPGAAAALSRLGGSERIAGEHVTGQLDKRPPR